MNNAELAIKFSNERYCTKKDVIEAMKTPLIDSIWNSVLEYRSSFSYPLGLKHINNSQYQICLTPTMVERINSIERKLLNIEKTYFKMTGSNEQKLFKINSYLSILSKISQKYNINVDNIVIESIIKGSASALSPDALILNRYLQGLLNIENNALKDINFDTLAKLYGLLMGTDVLPRNYRNNEVDNNLSRVVIGKLYLGIPTNLIENNMEQLFNFISNSSVSMFIKAISSFYFIYYVRPFNEYTEELAILTLKKVLASNDLGEIASLINFESLLEDKEKLESFIVESQKTLDLTYLLDYIISQCENCIDTVNEEILKIQSTVIRSEIHQLEEDNILNSNNAQVNLTNYQTQLQNTVSYSQSIAISNVPTGLNEEEATALENHLMELNPNLSRGQAYFYARHCTLGMNYTISQYKKSLNCAYETARSSMDNLVMLGYYRKECLKNKYIYTPVKKG